MSKKTEEIDLDSAAPYGQYDAEGMFAKLAEMPAQCLRAWKMAQGLK